MPNVPSSKPTQQLAVDPCTAASLISSTEPSLEKDRATGHLGIPYVKAGRKVIYCLSDLQAWLDERKVIPVANGGLK